MLNSRIKTEILSVRMELKGTSGFNPRSFYLSRQKQKVNKLRIWILSAAEWEKLWDNDSRFFACRQWVQKQIIAELRWDERASQLDVGTRCRSSKHPETTTLQKVPLLYLAPQYGGCARTYCTRIVQRLGSGSVRRALSVDIKGI